MEKENISCNVVAAYFHDHIFIAKKDAGKAMEVLHALKEVQDL
ncbi:ACT domain-containing protein [Chryseobacterium sp. CH21]